MDHVAAAVVAAAVATAAAVAVNLGVYPQAIGIVRGGGGVAARSFFILYVMFFRHYFGESRRRPPPAEDGLTDTHARHRIKHEYQHNSIVIGNRTIKLHRKAAMSIHLSSVSCKISKNYNFRTKNWLRSIIIDEYTYLQGHIYGRSLWG